ncbi:hypothetical protein QWY87_01735 [Lutimonas halocynthiae]|uniref:hypothetical protein n=1 Tax=Lutimonas halocynthiae TaxID=1446477 RepID=UPI0025B60D67|nr:hypothetical protein [Lutimonas halocynthiae]MDN3641404.1 hypothetical protein [Lutimonas halocynthiae]
MQDHIAVSLIICYLTLSFGYSILEKMIQWQSSKNYYVAHFKNTFLKHHISQAIVFVIILEIICVSLSIIGLYRLFVSNESQTSLWGLAAMAITLIVLMTGQRIAQDYSGAMNITVYFILTVMGIYIL